MISAGGSLPIRNDIRDAIAEGRLTRLESRVAAYVLSRPESLVTETSGAIAQKLDVSAMTVTRFFRKLGFDSAAIARAASAEQLFGSPSERIGLRFERFNEGNATGGDQTDLNVAMSGLTHAMERRTEPAWARTVDLVASSDTVHVIGFQTMRYLADGLCMRLQYVRPNVHLLDGGDGVYASLLTDPAPSRVLIVIDTFRYAAQGPLLAAAARERGIEIVLFCDTFCEWAVSLTEHIHAFPSESHFFIGMPVGLNFALNLLVQDVIARRGGGVRDQIDILSAAQQTFGQFLR